MATKEFLCALCAGKGKTCCQWSEVYTTRGDVGRIARHTGLAHFIELAGPVNPEYADQIDDPVWQAHVFRKDGTRRVLKKFPSGDCVFLGPTGCRLSLDVRPLVCRLYPFSYTAAGIGPALDTGCPHDLLDPGETVIEALHMRIDQARDWHKKLYEEILFDGDDDRTDLRFEV